jgi:putative CocE/NonD family hydrolase
MILHLLQTKAYFLCLGYDSLSKENQEVLKMKIEWDVPIVMEDGITLKADIFKPSEDGRYPVLMTYGPYGKGLAFQEGYKVAWDNLIRDHPDAFEGSSCRYANWETVDPEYWTKEGYICIRVDSRGAGRSPGMLDVLSMRETKDYYQCIEWAAQQP